MTHGHDRPRVLFTFISFEVVYNKNHIYKVLRNTVKQIQSRLRNLLFTSDKVKYFFFASSRVYHLILFHKNTHHRLPLHALCTYTTKFVLFHIRGELTKQGVGGERV